MDILHCDLNNFYASVEQVLDPRLAGKFVAVAGNTETRTGIVLAKNIAAKKCGVKTGDALWQARLKCPQIIFVPPHFKYYEHYSERVKQIYCRYTDLVEPFGMDECWLDVTASKLFGTPQQIADEIRSKVKEETGLTVSVGVSFTKTFAKLGSDLKKPDATTVITRQNFKQKVWTLPVEDMINVGGKTAAKLNRMGILTLGQLAETNPELLRRSFGAVGLKLRAAARGEDTDPVARFDQERQPKSVGHGMTLPQDLTEYSQVEQVITLLAEMVTTRLRDYGLLADTVHLCLRMSDLSYVGKQCKVNYTFCSHNVVVAAAKLLRALWKGNGDKPVRAVTVQLSGLVPVSGNFQQTIFDDEETKRRNLEFTVDKIRKKYGFNAICKGSLLNTPYVADKDFYFDDAVLPFKR